MALEIYCPVCCLPTQAPETVPHGQVPRCCQCSSHLANYRPCVICALDVYSSVLSCPKCGQCLADPYFTADGWLVPAGLVLEALSQWQAEVLVSPRATSAVSARADTGTPVSGASKNPPSAQSNGSILTSRSASSASQKANGNGSTVHPAVLSGGSHGSQSNGAASLPPGLQTAADAIPPIDDATGGLFGGSATVEVSRAATLAANLELITNHTRLAEVVAELATAPMVAVDTETTGLDPFVDNTLLLVQVATPERAYLVDARRVDPRPLRRILEDSHILKLLQNAKFDYKMLKAQLGISTRNMYDTMLAERLLTAGISREIGLASLAAKYAGMTLDKSVRKSFINSNGDFSEDQLRYAARDALVLFTIHQQQREKLKQERLLKIADLEFKTVVAVSDMELAGCLIDQPRWRKIIEAATVDRDRSAEELGTMLVEAGAVPQLTLFGAPAINLNSNAQLIETFKRMNIDLPDTMEATLLKETHPAIKKLLEYRGFEKMLSAFGEKFLELIHPKTGRIHPDFNQLGADTGRFSCTNPNVQQIPATSDFRSCFIAPPGYKLITCDYSQAELRILAQLSEDPAFVEAFTSGGDLHQLTASQMYQVPPDQVSKQMRSAAKVINFGLAYGRGPAALGVQLGVSTEEAKKMIEQYFKAYAGIGRWLDKAGRDAVRKGFSTTMIGRKRYYPELDSSDAEFNKKRSSIERQGKNSPIQGCLPGHVRIFEQSHGYVPIAALCGQLVSVWDGDRFSRAHVVPSGKKQLVKLTFYGGHYIECSPDHRFLVRAPNGRSLWKTPSEFKPQDRVVLTQALPEWRCAFDVPEPSARGIRNASLPSRGLTLQLQSPYSSDLAPRSIWQDSLLLKGYLRSLFDGDGVAPAERVGAVPGQDGTYLLWAREVQEALLLFGIRARVRTLPGDGTIVQVRKGDMSRFTLQIGCTNHFGLAPITARSCALPPEAPRRGVRVRSVEVTELTVEMYDVVNSTTGRFMANGLVVHNSNADMTKLALIGLNDVLRDYDARVVNTVHDEIVVEAREDQAEVVCSIVEREMVKAGEQIIKLVPIVADAKIADYWSK